MRGARRRLSLQLRITAIAALVSFVVATGAAVATIDLVERELVEATDRNLTETARFLERARGSSLLDPEAAPSDLFVQVVAPDGRVVGGTPQATELGPLAGEALVDTGRVELTTASVDDVGTVRVLVAPIPDSDTTLMLGRPIGQVEATRSLLVNIALVGIPLLVAGMAALVWIVVGRALRPVEAVRLAVRDVTEQDLSRRLPVPDTGDELSRLVETLNGMLDRLEGAVDRERTLVADASHELQSPLAGARALLETEPADPSARLASRAEALAALDRLQVLVEDLLVLARSDHEPLPSNDRPVDLDDLVLQHAADLRASTALAVDVTGVSGGQVLGDEADLVRVVANLSSNGLRHAATTLRFEVVQEGDVVHLVVEDDGPGVPAADRERIFERFTRLDAARQRGDGGAGLGLAIVSSLVEAHGGTVVVEDARGGGARFVVTLPANPDA